MRRLLLCVVVVLAGAMPALRAEESARSHELRHLLDRFTQFKGFDDPKTTLSEALEFLSKRYNLSFDINKHAFKKADVEEVDKLEIVGPNSIPAMNTRLGRILKKILSRVSPSATYIIRDDMIEITTTQAIRKEFFADRPDGPIPPLIAASFEKVPLRAALRELAHDGNIVLDCHAKKDGDAAVTADFVNVPLDTAVAVLADMAGFKAVAMDNVLYVTDKNNARRLMEEREWLRRLRQSEKKEKAVKLAENTSDKDKKQTKSEKQKVSSHTSFSGFQVWLNQVRP